MVERSETGCGECVLLLAESGQFPNDTYATLLLRLSDQHAIFLLRDFGGDMESDSITRQIQIDADSQRVWDALSDPTAFGEWFRVKLDGPFVVGETTTGRMTYPGHEGVPWTSVTEVMEPPKRLVFRWPDCPSDEEAGPDTVWLTVAFTLQPREGGTLVTVTETGFAALPKDRCVSMLRDNFEGWEIQTVNLKRHVEG